MRSPTLVLAAHSLRRIRPMVIGMAIVLGGFQFLLTQVATFLMKSNAFGLMPSLLPDFLRSMAGPSMLTFMSFEGVVAFGYFHPVVLAAHLGLAIAIATEPAAEVETRFADLTLARPLARHQAITRTVVVLIVAEAAMLLVMTMSTLTGLACCTPRAAPRLAPATIRSLAVMLAALTLCWGGVALAVASSARRRATASGATAVTALAAYLLDYLGRVWDPARYLSTLSPFHYFEPMALLSGTPLDWRDIVVLLGIWLAATATGYILFSQRDL
jgi:beta-exotoxin I transport system permease protein